MTLTELFAAIEAIPGKVSALFADTQKSAAKVAELETQLTQAQSATQTAKDQAQALQTDLATAQARVTDLESQLQARAAEITRLKASAQTAEQHGEALAKDKIGSLGLAPIPEGGPSGASAPSGDLRKQYQTLLQQDPAAAGRFYAQHRTQLFG